MRLPAGLRARLDARQTPGAPGAARGDVRVKKFLYDPVVIQFSARILDAEHSPNNACSRTSIGRTD
jgi:hypothetical protein